MQSIYKWEINFLIAESTNNGRNNIGLIVAYRILESQCLMSSST